jgi:hypothetical protein
MTELGSKWAHKIKTTVVLFYFNKHGANKNQHDSTILKFHNISFSRCLVIADKQIERMAKLKSAIFLNISS